MTCEPLTLWLYINNISDEDNIKFKKLFAQKIDALPNKVVSSKQIRKVLDIDSLEQEALFIKVWMKYFKLKVYQ